MDNDLDEFTGSLQDEQILWHESRLIGDVNNDGGFNSRDLVSVSQSAEYEDGIDGNSTFTDGDWNGDFDSSDLVAVFQVGNCTSDARLTSVAAAADRCFRKKGHDIAVPSSTASY